MKKKTKINNLEKRIKELEEIDKCHQEQNGELQVLLSKFEKTGKHIPRID